LTSENAAADYDK